MKFVTTGGGRNKLVAEIPETWAEAEQMVTKALSYHEGRGRNVNLQSVCARIAYGLTCNQELTPDPTTALAFLIQRICIRKGAGLEK
jgi:hypothetical protein